MRLLGVTASKPVADFMEIYGQMTAGSDEFDVYLISPLRRKFSVLRSKPCLPVCPLSM